MYFIKENKDFFQSIWWEDNENVIRAINFMLMAKSYLISKNIDFVMFEGIGSILLAGVTGPNTSLDIFNNI
jgi:hypothetical protein